MSALPQPIRPATDDRLDPDVWIEASEAASLLGLSISQLNRRCSDMADQGFARKASPRGGQRRWYIIRSYHPALSPASERDDDAGSLPAAFLALPMPKQRGAWKRRACVAALRKLRADSSGSLVAKLPALITRLQSEHGIKVSRNSLYRWDAAYQSRADIIKLVDHRGGDQKSIGDPAAWAYFRDLFLDSNRPKKKKVYDLTAAKAHEEGWEWPSYATVCRRLDEIIPPEVQMYHRERSQWLKQMQPTIEQDAEAWATGTLWEGDHAELDLICRHGDSLVRPWITAWMDWRSRRVVGYVISIAPNSSTIQAAFKAGMTDEDNRGGPDTVRIDNGKDYKARKFHGQTGKERSDVMVLNKGYINETTFNGIFDMLDIDVIFTIPRGPNGKSRLERWFGTLHQQFETDYYTFSGSTPQDRPHDHAQTMKAKTKIPSFERVCNDIDEYIAAYNASADHQRKDMVDDDGARLSPDEAMAAWGRDRRPADPETLDMILGQEWPGTVTVGRNGITIRPFGVPISYGAFDTRLTPYKARLKKDRTPLVVSYDPANKAKTIRVWTADFKTFVGVFNENEKGGGLAADRDNAKELIREKAAYGKSLKLVKEEGKRGFMTAAQRLRFNEAKRRAAEGGPPRPPGSDAPIRLVQTPVDAHAKRVQSAEARATGTEGASPRPISDIREMVKRAGARKQASEQDAPRRSLHVDLSDMEAE